MPQDYNNTLNLLKTEFPMRAGLPAKEPVLLKEWEGEDLYHQLIEKNEGKPLFVLHDGPPYANGDIHLGTALNKVLKDFIVRYKNMSGFQSPFVPGWDTHGLPTELKARKKAGLDKTTTISDVKLRQICREFTLSYLDDQRSQFIRLGALGEWGDPYITLLPAFEAKQIEIFCEMACNGYIYKGLKPVYWCPECVTALAEAEIEYADDPCHSIYVSFQVTDDLGKLSALGADPKKTSFVIWTTTTWTLPGNVAICVGPEFSYVVVEWKDRGYVMAEELYENAMKAAGALPEEYRVLGKLKGKDLEYMKTAHPFLDREPLVIVGDHVTLESGTGCVHTAPGHGVEDFEVCKNYPELPVVVPVNHHGVLTEEAGPFAGLTTEKAGKVIADALRETGNLFALEKITHQYPHCWRCKEPVLFRATEQWFCSVEDFKDRAIDAVNQVEWIPGWGKERISGMVRERNDWCISRQRKWGVPIPIFYCKKCGKEHIKREAIMAVSKLFGEKGSDAWYTMDASEILPAGTACSYCGHTEFDKEKDIMDVWFDSGVSHAAVCGEREYLHWPADVYLEGADQFRGWFQSSLLTSVVWRDKAPYKAVISHGWVVDGEGKKMSKSLGNGILPPEIVDQYGADILRLWVASSDYHSDIRISKDILKQLSEAYRKIRNTARFILANISDFNPDTDCVPLEELLPLDKWALMKLDELSKKAKDGYDRYEFHQIYHAVHNFCVVDMSNFYLDVLKDRLYVEKKDSVTRRAAQTVIYTVLDTITRLVSPILAFTAEEIWSYMPHTKADDARAAVLNEMLPPTGLSVDGAFAARWDRIHALRDDVKKALELARNEKVIGASLDAKLTLYCDGELYEFVESIRDELPEIFIVSQLDIVKGAGGECTGEIEGLSVTVSKAGGEKCARCWSYRDSVGSDTENPELCERCASILKSI